MKKGIYVILLILNTGWLSGQSPVRKFVPGTKCSFEVTEGFKQAQRFNGFENEKQSAAMIVSVLKNSVEANKKAFSKDEIKRRGMVLVNYSEPVVNGLNTTLYEVTQMNKEVNYRKYILIFGDTGFTVMINSGAPDSNLNMVAAMKAMTLSVKYEPGVKENLFDGVDFVLDTGRTGFLPAKYSIGGLVLTRDGLTPTKSEDQATFLAGPSIKKINSLNKKDFAIKRLKTMPVVDSLLNYKVDSLTIDGLQGYEITGRALNKKKAEIVVYELMLFVDDSKYYVMAGHATDRFEENTNRFSILAKSFKRK